MIPRPLLLCLGLLLAPAAAAGELRYTDVRYHDGVYTLDMDMVLDAGFDRVRALITDYDHMARLSGLLTASSLVDRPGGGLRRRLQTRICILFFCFTPVVVEDVEEIGRDRIVTTVVPALSDFRSGSSQWWLTVPEPGRTRIRFEYRMEPDFWIPPLIGPLFIKAKLRHEAEKTINKIEKLARD
jgi:hypothetical protein